MARYRTARDKDPPGLFYARSGGAVWVASEPLDGQLSGTWNGEDRTWTPLAKRQQISRFDVLNDVSRRELLYELRE